MTESKINDLLSKMNLEEKIGQLNQYFSFGDFNPEMIRKGKASSVINAAGTPTGAKTGVRRSPRGVVKIPARAWLFLAVIWNWNIGHHCERELGDFVSRAYSAEISELWVNDGTMFSGIWRFPLLTVDPISLIAGR